MDDQYLDAFIRESEEAITELNNSLLDLESDPSDREAMDSIFRTAHTLKGNFGAMGFDDASNLAHAIEDLLDAMRQGEMEVTPDRMDLIFAGVDRIEVIVREIEADGESTTSTDEMVAQLRAVLEGEADGGAGSGESGEGYGTGEDADLVGDVHLVPSDADGRVVHTRVTLGDSDMLGVDAMLVLENTEGEFDVLASEPDRDTIEEGGFDPESGFVLYLDAEDAEAVAAELEGMADVERVEATDVTGSLPGDGSGADDADADTDPSDAGDTGDTPDTGQTGPETGTSDAPDSGGSDADGTDSPSGDSQPGADSVDEIKSVRVDVDQLDDLHGLVEQLVTSRIKLRRAVEQSDLDAAGENLNELDKITANLQNTVMDMRLIPLKKVVGKFPRMVRDLARELDKDVEFTIEGEEIELDRTILTEISDPLMHIIRNSLDHGIESPEERERVGKPRTGQVVLRASRERDHVIIQVEDDGAGLDVEEIRNQAVQQGIRSPEELDAMDDSSIYDLVFHPGFSTADEVTDTSGRGVGMDVVHDTVTQLDGSVSVDSTPGEGTTVSLRLPVTMAIVKVLFVQVGDEEYGIPLKNVDEITPTTEVKRVNSTEVIKHDGDIYPVVHLAEAFDVPGVEHTNGHLANGNGHSHGGTEDGDGTEIEAASGTGAEARAGTESGVGTGSGIGAGTGTGTGTENDDGMLVRIRESERQIALHCDAVNSQEEVVVKPLEGILSGTSGLSGTAVLGDGNIVHIVDVVTL